MSWVRTITDDTRQKIALEMTMREVLSGLEELAIERSYTFSAGGFEIIAIETPDTETRLLDCA